MRKLKKKIESAIKIMLSFNSFLYKCGQNYISLFPQKIFYTLVSKLATQFNVVFLNYLQIF